ncbi:V-type ATP synthase subunit F [Candidatus Poribacteria bacterium]|nr:MAG: V-type ATP synthase subunit F [Candidatus Poribacteria bacterium]
MSEIALIGDRDSIMGFKALGAEVYPVEGVEGAVEALKDAIRRGFKIVFITEQVMPERELIDQLLGTNPFPVVTPIPGNKGSLGLGMRRMRELIVKAAGADILGEE